MRTAQSQEPLETRKAQASATPAAPAEQATPLAPPAADPAAAPPLLPLLPLLPWLLGADWPEPDTLADLPLDPVADATAAWTASERNLLKTLDRALAQAVLPDGLLPRAPALIPQLLALLRHSELPVPLLAERVAKDMLLTAEVLRLASSPYYRAQAGVTDLQQAIALIGTQGLQTVVARVVLKPIFDASPGPWSARAAERLWLHAEALAAQAAQQAQRAGLPAFDGYLAGLMSGCGWTIALRLFDRAELPLLAPASISPRLAQALGERAHRLFGSAASRWAITPGFTALAHDACNTPLADSKLALAGALRAAWPGTVAALTPATTP